MARIASLSSKRGSVKLLEDDFGIRLRLDTVYQMMDMLDDERVEKLKERIYRAACGVFGEQFDVVFYDCTTLHFESFSEDELRKNGYSKDMKSNQPQVLLAVIVTKEGIPVSYEVYAGDKFEGYTLKDALNELRIRYKIDDVIFVADSTLLSKDNLKLLEGEDWGESEQREEGKKWGYIVGARLRNTSNVLQKKILDKSFYSPMQSSDSSTEGNLERVTIFDLDENRRLIVTYSKKRAEKDRLDREKALDD